MCFDINCSCVDAKKDTCTSVNISKDKSLKTGDTCLHCMILNQRINVAKNKREKQNLNQKRGMQIVVCKHIFNESLLD